MTDSKPDLQAMLLQIKQLHGMKQDGVCITCGMNWPCDAAKLVDALEWAVNRIGMASENAGWKREALASIEERLSR